VTLIEAGRGAEAVEVLERARQLVRTGTFETMEAVIRRNYARALLRDGQAARARAELETAWRSSESLGLADNAATCVSLLIECCQALKDAECERVWRSRLPERQ
jgi:tellurite resistance protein